MRFRCDGIFNDLFVTCSLPSVSVKEFFFKSANIRQGYGQEYVFDYDSLSVSLSLSLSVCVCVCVCMWLIPLR